METGHTRCCSSYRLNATLQSVVHFCPDFTDSGPKLHLQLLAVCSVLKGFKKLQVQSSPNSHLLAICTYFAHFAIYSNKFGLRQFKMRFRLHCENPLSHIPDVVISSLPAADQVDDYSMSANVPIDPHHCCTAIYIITAARIKCFISVVAKIKHLTPPPPTTHPPTMVYFNSGPCFFLA